eukprot:360023-Chlamydomonas_euryale.AAC.4
MRRRAVAQRAQRRHAVAARLAGLERHCERRGAARCHARLSGLNRERHVQRPRNRHREVANVAYRQRPRHALLDGHIAKVQLAGNLRGVSMAHGCEHGRSSACEHGWARACEHGRSS